MRRFAAGLLAAAVGLGGVAYAGRRHENWKAVERLAEGVPIEVELVQGSPERCRMVSADDSTLTCVRDADPNADWSPLDTARVVIPRRAVRMVWIWVPPSNPHPEFWIAGIFGFAVGARACIEAGPLAMVGCGFMGALIAAGFVAVAESTPPRYPWGLPGPPSYPRPPRQMQRKLWYRAPVVKPAP